MAFTSDQVITLTVSFLSFLVAVASAAHASRSNTTSAAANKTSEQALQYQILIPMLMEYKSAEMLLAVRSLWAFARTNPNNVKEAFELKYNEENGLIQKIEPTKKVEYLRTTLDYQRRTVTQFYGILISILEHGGIQKDFVYLHWSRSDLSIITEVLIPMELYLAKIDSYEKSPTLTRLKSLYDNCPHETSEEASPNLRNNK